MLKMFCSHVFLILFCFSTPVAGADWGINLYGISYHPDRKDSNGNKFNELNPGLGFSYGGWNRRHVWIVEGGIFHNSQNNFSKYVSVSYRYRISGPFSLGGMTALFQSPRVNRGKVIFAPLPAASLRYGPAILHVIYMPRFKDMNRNAAFGLYLTILRGSR